jgi:outer membrane receptor protein involved in Fe transport
MIRPSDADSAYAGTYLGWPVDYIDFPVNEGRAHVYGGTMELDFLHVPGGDARLEARAALSLVNGRVWEDQQDGTGLPLGAMVPVQARFTADAEWRGWTVAPRLAILGRQRLLAAIVSTEAAERRTLGGYVTLDVNVRRRLSSRFDAFVTIENALDRRYRAINVRAYSNPEELIGAPQNPRRFTVGFDLRLQ